MVNPPPTHRFHIIPILLVAAITLGAPTQSHAFAPMVAATIDAEEFTLTHFEQLELCTDPPNRIVAENCRPGTQDWELENFTTTISGYASYTSVNIGEEIDFFVNTDASSFDMHIYRFGYYNAKGARQIEVLTEIPAHVQPPCLEDASTGLTSCSNWTSSYYMKIPHDWVSGVYMIKLVRGDNGGENYILFVVRDDESDADMLYQQSASTYHAYSNYGGKSLYTFNSGNCNTVSEEPRAVKVSLLRPYSSTPDDPNTFFRAELPMIYWLEAQGYDVAYSTNLDTHRSGQPGAHNKLLDHKIFLSVGHDEYWSQGMRDAITQARDAGVNIASFSANTGYWRIRLEPDPWNGASDATLVAYKSTESGPHDPSGDPTGTWRDPIGADAPENQLLGIQYFGDNDSIYFPLQVTPEQAQDRVYRNTGLQDMPPGTVARIGQNLFGWEWDAVANNGLTPEGLTVLAASPVYGKLLTDAGNYRQGVLQTAYANTTRFIAPSGAQVFAGGTIQWSWGLALREPNPYIQQITYNVLADMGTHPATPADTLVLDGEASLPTPPLTSMSDLEVLPVISNLQTSATDSSAFVAWETDTPTTGQVWIGFEPEHIYEVMPQHDSDPVTKHELGLGGLEPNTTYYFQVVSMNANDGTTMSPVGEIRTESRSFFSQVRHTLMQSVRLVMCWVRANTSAAIALGAGFVFAFALLAWNIGTRIRRRRLAKVY